MFIRSMLLTQGNRGRKEGFWNEVFHMMSCIPWTEMIVQACDTNGHVGSSNVDYDGTYGGFGY